MNKVISFERPHEWYFKTGLKHAKKENNSLAVKFILKASEMDPGNRDYYLHIARLFCKCGEYIQSNKILLHLVPLLENDGAAMDDMLHESYFLLSYNCVETEEYEKAVNYAEKCIAAMPDGRYSGECEAMLEYFNSGGYMSWDERWDKVIELCMKNSEGVYGQIYRDELEILMVNIGYNIPDSARKSFNKPEIWAAVLEYMYSIISRIKKTRKSVAAKYGISDYTLNKHMNYVFSENIFKI